MNNFDIIENLKTPCFVIDEKELYNSINFLKKSIKKYWPNTIIGYSYKTNSLLWLVDYIKKQNIYAEVVSDDEYDLAKYIGYEDNHIIYNGPVKTKENLLNILNANGIVNIDSINEINWILESNKKYNLSLRVNIDIEKECPNESQNPIYGGRFGFSYENGDLNRIISLLKKNKHNVTGLHMHCSSKTRSLKIYETLTKFAIKIAKENSLDLQYLDIGGGFFNGVPGKPNFEDYFSLISKLLSENNFTKTVLIVEPGISLIGSNISYFCKVIENKENNHTHFAVTDGTRLHIDPFFHRENYLYNIYRNKKPNASNKDITIEQFISGYTCMENDRMMKITDYLLNKDDVIEFKKLGGYTITFLSDFIQFSPRVYRFNSINNELKLIKDKRSLEIILCNQYK